VFTSGSAAIAAAVALPLRRPFIDRETAPRRAPRPVPAPKPAKTAKPPRGILRGLGAFIVALPDHLWFDKVVRGRAWIPLLGVLLAGIVAAQVEILKLGASMGRSLEQTTTLTTQNEQLRYSVASLSNDQRIERLATSMGMVLPPPGSVGYISASLHADVTRALGNIHAPEATGFMALAPTNGALVTGAGTSMLPTTPGVLAQAGTPGSATPTSTPSPTSTVPSAGAATSAATRTSGTSGTSTITATGATTPGTPTDTTPTQTPANSQTPTVATQTPTGSQTPTTATQTPTTTQSAASTGTQSSSQAPATGAAAIQPAGGTQQSSGG
jgi:cell division protein FtsL